MPYGLLGLGAMALAPGLACRQIVDFPDPPGPQTSGADADAAADAGTNACGLPYGTHNCASCAAASCCHESSACAAMADCAPYEACVGMCRGDPRCRAQCEVDHPPGTSSEGSALAACLARKCETPCGLTCGALLYGATPHAAAACQACNASNGCDEQRACASSADCDSLMRCRLKCGFYLDCIESCFTARGVPWLDSADASAAPSFVRLDFPSTGSACDSLCELGTNWSCVRWPESTLGPKPKSTSFAYSLQVQEYGTGMRLAGVDVSVCEGGDLVDSCNIVAGPAQTDDGGLVRLQVPQPNPNVAFSGYLQMMSPTFVPSLYNAGFPVSEANLSMTGQFGFFLLSQTAAQSLNKSLNKIPDETLGAVVVNPRDCLYYPAPGVEVAMSGSDPIPPIYNLSLSATDTTGRSDTRNAYFSNVPPGEVEFTVTPKALGKPSNRVRVLVRPGFLTAIVVPPSL